MPIIPLIIGAVAGIGAASLIPKLIGGEPVHWFILWRAKVWWSDPVLHQYMGSGDAGREAAFAAATQWYGAPTEHKYTSAEIVAVQGTNVVFGEQLDYVAKGMPERVALDY